MYYDFNKVYVYCGSLYIKCRMLLNYECYELLDIVFFFLCNILCKYIL